MGIIIGIVTIAFKNQIATIFAIVTGIWIIYSGILRLSSSLKLRKMSEKATWLISTILSVIMIVIGAIVIGNAGKGGLMSMIGWMILIYSILDIIDNVIFLNNVKE